MYSSTVRRSGKTYGKTGRSALVHDLFDFRANHDVPSGIASSTLSLNPSSDAQPFGPEFNGRQREKLRASSPMRSDSHLSQSSTESANKETNKLVVENSLYEMNSSNEDSNTEIRVNKRRRIIKKPDASKIPDPGGAQISSAAWLHNKGQSKRARVDHDASLAVPKSKPSAPHAKAARKTKALSDVSNHPTRKQASSTKTTKSLPIAQVTERQGASRLPIHLEKTNAMGLSAANAADHILDHARHSAPKYDKSPPRSRSSPIGTGSGLSSPGSLNLTDLQLEAVGPSAEYSPDPSSDGSTVKKRNRRRLIDRLDAPSQRRDCSPESCLSDTTGGPGGSVPQTQGQVRGRASRDNRTRRHGPNSTADTTETQDPQSIRNRISRPRTTYATQRSHLSDMVDGLDDSGVLSSQKSTEELLLSAPISTSASQLEIDEEESDDQTGAGRLKSIHELRQSGVNNRFDREIDALFEDISADSPKATRLQALMKVVTKLHEHEFARHLTTSSRIRRLVQVAHQQTDLPTSILIVGVFLILTQSETISLDGLSQLFKATGKLASAMLVDGRPLSKIARDRKQNLSRATIQDLVSLEKSEENKESSLPISSRWAPDATALHCLEQILRKTIQLGDTSAKLPTSVYGQLMQLVQSEIRSLRDLDDDSSSLWKLQTALSLLELCSVVVDNADLHIGDQCYEDLGNALAGVLYMTNSRRTLLEGRVLRVVVSLSNNNPRICQLLGHTAMSKATFDIIDRDFLRLARQAETEQPLDQRELDSVLLALGCLLNLAECDNTLRDRLSRMAPGKSNHIAQLTSIFNAQVSKVDEAMTREQSQVSVAFGYLSMLLCTLSLDPVIKDQVTQLLMGKSFEELCNAAEKFFSHLRTLESIAGDDASLSSFTARFRAILETIRASKM